MHYTTRYTVTVPLQYNDGTPVDPDTLAGFERDMLGIAGGFTAADGRGAWRDLATGTVYSEPVRVYTIDANRGERVREEIHGLARWIGRVLRQEAVYVTHHDLTATLIEPRTIEDELSELREAAERAELAG